MPCAKSCGPRRRSSNSATLPASSAAPLPWDAGRAPGCRPCDAHFFEFVERDLWDRGEPKFLTLDGIRKGIDYYIVVTTPSGLYRYFINDLVRVSGYLHKTPLLKFVQKGKGVTNITGEKLYESQVLTAVRAALDRPRARRTLRDDACR